MVSESCQFALMLHDKMKLLTLLRIRIRIRIRIRKSKEVYALKKSNGAKGKN